MLETLPRNYIVGYAWTRAYILPLGKDKYFSRLLSQLGKEPLFLLDHKLNTVTDQGASPSICTAFQCKGYDMLEY
jgi:hypothetical protein